MVKKGLVILLFFVAVSFIYSENIISTDMELYNTVLRTRDTVGDSYWAYGISGTGALSFKSTGNRNVRADLAIDVNYPDISGIPVLTLQKAYVKAKFPDFRLTVGKTRLGWGDGFVFNSGDVVFGSTSPYVDLIGSEIRTETSWLTSVNYPLGRFSFIEFLVKAPDLDGSQLGRIENGGVGLRLYTKAAGVKIETGYYFDGEDSTINSTAVSALHRPFVSLQGNIGPDWFINSSLAVPSLNGDNLETIVKETYSISAGLFHLQEIGYDDSLTFRLEAVVLPFLKWSDDEGSPGDYALLIYPEISWARGQNVTIFIRSIVSPIDFSAMITTGYSWNVFEGFNLLANAIVLAGGGDDTFSWSKNSWSSDTDYIDGISFMTGVQYIY